MKNNKINFKKVVVIATIPLVATLSIASTNNKNNLLNNHLNSGNEFNVESPDIGKINNASISAPSATTAILTITTSIDSDVSINKDTNPYTIEMWANVNGVNSRTKVWTSETQTKELDGGQMNIENLTPSTTYKGIKLKLVGEDGEVIGDPFNITSDFTTDNQINGMSEPTIVADSITTTGFSINTTLSSTEDNSNGDVEGYLAIVTSSTPIDNGTNDQKEIWRSDIKETSGDITFDIDKLNPGVEYSDIKISIISAIQEEDVIVEPTDVDTTTTLDEISEIDSSTAIDEETIGSNSFNINAKVNSVNGKTDVKKYKFKVIGTGSGGNPDIDFTSNEFGTTDAQVLTIDGLAPATHYTNIKISVVYVGEEDSPLYDKTLDDVDTTNQNVQGIDTVDVPADTITTTSVMFTLEAICDDHDKVNPYFVGVTANNGSEDVSWSSEHSYKNGNINGEQIKTVVAGVTYTDINFQLYEDQEHSKKLGDAKALGKDIEIPDSEPPTVTGIDDAEIKVVDDTSVTINMTVASDVEIGHDNPFFVQMNAKINGVDFSMKSSTQTDAGNIDVVFDELTPETHYEDVTLQLLEINGTTPIGDPFDSLNPNEFTTDAKLSKVAEIESATISDDSITKTSFEFDLVSTVQTMSNDGIDVQDYKIQVLATVDADAESIIWTSNTITNSEATLTVDQLKPGTLYKDVKFQLVEDDGTTPIGSVFDSTEDVQMKSEGEPGVDSASIVPDLETIDGFSITSEVDESTITETTTGYELKVFANDDDINPIWTSQELNKTGTQVSEVDGLTEATEYTNIKIAAFNGDTQLGSLIDVADSVTTLDTIDSIDNGTIDMDSITGEGFSFLIDIHAKGGKDKVDLYSIEVLSVNTESNSEEVIWTSSQIQQVGTGLSFTVDGLSPETEYKDIQFKIIDKGGKVMPGISFDSKTDVTTNSSSLPSSLPGWAIALIVIGSLFIVGLIVFAILFFIKNNKKEEKPKQTKPKQKK